MHLFKKQAKTHLLAPEHHRNLMIGFETRQFSDYNFEASVTEEKAREVLSGARAFLEAARQYLYE